MNTSNRPVFSDPTGRRWRFAKLLGAVGAVLLACVLLTLAWAAFAPPTLKVMPLHWRAAARHAGAPPSAPRERRPGIVAAHPAASATGLRYGFFVNWDDNSFVSLKRNATSLDVLVPEWLHVTGMGDVKIDDPVKETRTRTWLKEHAGDLKITPLINNFSQATQSWDPGALQAILSTPEARKAFATRVTARLAPGDAGLHLDFESVPDALQPAYVSFVQEIAADLHRTGRVLDISVPAGDEAFALPALAQAADHLFLMVYDEHAIDNPPGPVASQGWFESVLDQQFAALPADKLVVAIGAYGYDWDNRGHAHEVTAQEAWQTAFESSASITFDPDALNPAFSYDEDDGSHHTVWFLDAATAYNQANAALAMQPAGLALWRMGSEDPGLWAFFAKGRAPNTEQIPAMRTMQAGYDLVYEGDGEALRVTGLPAAGARTFQFASGENLIVGETINRTPKALTITRWGAVNDKRVALTFDDGPDPRWTPDILDILKANKTPATFFVVGQNVLAHPDLFERVVREGHDIGSHSFTHPNIGELNEQEAKVELSSTARLSEALIGLRPALFRPPYAEDVEPATVDDARIVSLASKLGYVTMGLRVDPGDWTKPGADAIVNETVAQVESGRGHVVLLHDSGGDRSQTIAALPRIIARLKADGWTFVTAHDLLGLSREAVMQTPPAYAAPEIMAERVAFFTLHYADDFIAALFITGLGLGAFRFLLIGFLAITQAIAARSRRDIVGNKPSVTVVVPAYNEETVIVETVRSILTTDLAFLDAGRFEVLIVDDGSSDATASVAQAAFADDPRVRVMRKPNGGKASAINAGAEASTADVIVVIDADTILDRAAIGLLARHFGAESVGAVAGNAKVGNRINLLTRFQALEYITSQNLDRRAFETLNAMTVIPGAIGAWRRTALLEIGGFSGETLAEDADATIQLQRKGWRVLYEPAAIARTEAPETIDAFMKQRFRWMYGTLQAAFKHRDAPAQPGARRLGWTILPNIVIFQVLFPLVSPLMDALMLLSLVAFGYAKLMHPASAPVDGFMVTLLFYAIFQAVELAGAAIGFLAEPGEDWRLLPLAVLQRFCYRQLLYWTAIRALISAIRGGPVGWGKLRRTARLHGALAPDKV